MIDREHDLPLTKQAAALDISRRSIYYLPQPVSAADLTLMRRADELHLEFPFVGSRMLRGLLVADGSQIGRRHLRALMQRMGIETVYRRPNTSKPAPGHKIYPYLLRRFTIDRPNQVWATDITYIPMARGFVYGRQHGLTKRHWREEHANKVVPMVMLKLAVPAHRVKTVTDAIIKGARTGQIGDGKIFVATFEEAIRIRTNERGQQALA